MAKVIVLSGAGLSAQSGISTFRDSNGLWENYDLKVVCDASSMYENKDITIEFYDKRREDIKDKLPNHAHKVLAKLKKQYPNDIALITQNVDDLFEKAGLDENELIHLHGYLPQIRCINEQCSNIQNIGYKRLSSYNNGVCEVCKSIMRPDIVFFGEMAPKYEDLNKHIQDCEMLVVIGTSGNVIGVNTLANFVDISILNNLEPSAAIDHKLFTKVIYDKATNAIDEIALDIKKFLNE